jgi:hypothetical protein
MRTGPTPHGKVTGGFSRSKVPFASRGRGAKIRCSVSGIRETELTHQARRVTISTAKTPSISHGIRHEKISALLCSALLLASTSLSIAAGPNPPSAKVELVAVGPSAGKIATAVSWADCVDPVGLDFVEIVLKVRPAGGAADGSNDYEPAPLKQIGTVQNPLNASGNWAVTFTGLTTGDTVVKLRYTSTQRSGRDNSSTTWPTGRRM